MDDNGHMCVIPEVEETVAHRLFSMPTDGWPSK